MRQPALLLLLPTILFAQGTFTVGGGAGSSNRVGPTSTQPSVPPQPTKPEDLCSVEGQVVNAVTGEPIRRASLLLMRSDPVPGETGPPTSYSTQSNSTGQFAMKDIEPGKYRLTVNRNGYVPFTYGARGPMQPGTTLSLIRQQHMADLALRLTPQAVITGRILDDEGEPVANARVALQSYRYINGRKQLTSSFLGGANTTNDVGEYRLFGVAPGKYYVSVTPMPVGQMFGVDRSASTGPEEDYVPTYYPGAVDASAASQLDVPAGGQLNGIDLILSKGRTVHVKGHITHGLSGRQNLSIFLTPRNPGAMMGPMRNNQVDAAGNFDIRHVTPGQYYLTVGLNEGGMSRQARVPVDVGGSNVEGLNIVIGPGITVKGYLRAEGDSATVDLSNVRLNLQPRESGGIMFGPIGQGKPNADGLFEISSVAADRYNLFVSGLPSGAYVKAIRSDQVDVLASGLDITSGASPADIEIVISPKAA
ncbi:MAG TPA: carboxypeptidase-like regulatory domain-containing protein, partial [Candidatus Acidoferrum sp.]|nr:carboxypeptidase-like regulatory domain-containing protein [Candidatus Acidoferrum sp.]